MTDNAGTLFTAFLNKHDEQAWDRVVTSLLHSINEVDRTATRIWFAFFPLALVRALETADDPAKLAARLLLQGRYLLEDQIDSSHTFLYGHRYWPEVKKGVERHALSGAAPSSLDLAAQIREIAGQVASEIRIDPSLVVGITAAGFMTLQQAGLPAFQAASGTVERAKRTRSAAEVLKGRTKDDSQGPLGFLRGDRKIWTVTFDESEKGSRFKLIDTQHLTTAAANDKRDYHTRDPRCVVREGPIPVQCRNAACGTCWVGVLGGAEKLSPAAPLESRKIKEFGYIDTDEQTPIIRLACQAQGHGAVSIVIPPWNGVFGRYLRGLKTEGEETNSNVKP